MLYLWELHRDGEQAIFFQTSLRVPSARPVSSYLRWRYSATRGGTKRFVMWLNDRARCQPCHLFWKFVTFVLPADYPLKIVRTDKYLEYSEIVDDFRAMVALPHGNVMQMMFYEASNMGLPVLLPDLRLMSRQPYLWWSERVAGSGHSPEHLHSFADPPQPLGVVERPHPVPFLVTTMERGAEYLKALLYWMRILDYFHWDWALHFESVPHMLELLLQDEKLYASSSKSRAFNQREKEQSLHFWRDGLSRLLGITAE
ncbi:unnamed protein product [Durusdinium trenchii]|uniref:Glycosyltransferase n=1 Tax=Durusdinium trenchii TaxID=1381693 RepID=A0ABP0RR89_9DINO